MGTEKERDRRTFPRVIGGLSIKSEVRRLHEGMDQTHVQERIQGELIEKPDPKKSLRIL